MIDLSGLPSGVSTQTGCDQSATSPFTGKSPPNTSGVADCTVNETLEANQDPDPGVDPAKQYANNLKTFQGYVDSQETAFLARIGAEDWSDLGGTGEQAEAQFKSEVDPLFTEEKVAGEPGVVPPRRRTRGLRAEVRRRCRELLRAVAQRRVQRPGRRDVRPGCAEGESGPGRAGALRGEDARSGAGEAASAAKAKVKQHAIVLASGKLTLKQGKHGKLVLLIGQPSAPSCAQRSAAEGLCTFSGLLVIHATHGSWATRRQRSR